MIEQAVLYWELAGQQALQRSAFIEAENYFSKGIRLLQTLPDTIERTQQEVHLQSFLGSALMMAKGISAAEVGVAFSRAYELCQRIENPTQFFNVLMRLRFYRDVRGEIHEAFMCAEEMMRIAQQMQEPGFLLQAHVAVGLSCAIRGQPIPASEHLAQATDLYDPQQHRSHAFLYGIDPKVGSEGSACLTLWLSGYPEQALQKGHAALTFARELSHPPSVVMALLLKSWGHVLRREALEASTLLVECINLCTEYGIPTHLGFGRVFQGKVLIPQSLQDE